MAVPTWLKTGFGFFKTGNQKIKEWQRIEYEAWRLLRIIEDQRGLPIEGPARYAIRDLAAALRREDNPPSDY